MESVIYWNDCVVLCTIELGSRKTYRADRFCEGRIFSSKTSRLPQIMSNASTGCSNWPCKTLFRADHQKSLGNQLQDNTLAEVAVPGLLLRTFCIEGEVFCFPAYLPFFLTVTTFKQTIGRIISPNFSKFCKIHWHWLPAMIWDLLAACNSD